MKVLVTSGGTYEQIDDVRTIRNTSTGRLGQLIADTLLTKGFSVDYVHGKDARMPTGKANTYEAKNVVELKQVLDYLLEENRYDGIVHAMAVSDYMIQSVTTFENLTNTLSSKSKEEALELMSHYPEDFNRISKISSEYENIAVLMKKAPKIIQDLKTKQPQSVVVGFKLLSDVPLAELIDVGQKLLMKNQCDYVLANDLEKISGDKHQGHLIDKTGNYQTYNTKQEIAQGIAKAIEGGLL